MHGGPLHLFYDDTGGSQPHVIVDLRRIGTPPRPHFCTVAVPAIFSRADFIGVLLEVMPELDCRGPIFLDDQVLLEHVSPRSETALVTMFPRDSPACSPLVMDTLRLMEMRVACRAHLRAASDRVPYRPERVDLGPYRDPTGPPGSGAFGSVLLDVLRPHASPRFPGSTWLLAVERNARLCQLDPALPPRVLLRHACEELQVSTDSVLRVPLLAPATPDEPPWVVVMHGAQAQGYFLLVDARRVCGPPCAPFWLLPVERRLTLVGLVYALRRAQPSLQQMGVLYIDSRPLRGHWTLSSRIHVLTLLPVSQDCYNMPALLSNARVLHSRPGFSRAQPSPAAAGAVAETAAASAEPVADTRRPASTTTTTMGAEPTVPFLGIRDSTSTTTRAGWVPGCAQDAVFVVALASPGNELRATRMTAHDDLVEVLLQLILPACQRNYELTGTSIRACPRVFRGRRGEYLTYCVFESQDPLTRNVWVDCRLDSRLLHVVPVEYGISSTLLLQYIGIPPSREHLLYVNGARWFGGIVAQDGNVITLCQRPSQAVSESLGCLVDRFPVFECLLRPLALPPTVPIGQPVTCTDLYQESFLRAGLVAEIRLSVALLGRVPAQSQAIIASVAFGAWPVGSGGPIPQDSEAIRERALSLWPGIDINTCTDTRQVLNDCCLYLARESRSNHIFWFRDGDGCDMLALQGDLDPATGIPVLEGTMIDVVRRAPGWGIYRVVQSGLALHNHGLVDQLDVNDLSSLDSDQTERMLASPNFIPEVASGSDVELVSSAEEEVESSPSFLQLRSNLHRGALAPAARTEASACESDVAGPREVPLVLKIWSPGCQPHILTVAHSATYEDVDIKLRASDPHLSVHCLAPVFPPGDGCFQCVAPGPHWNGRDAVVLLVAPAPHGTQAVHIASTDSEQSVLDRLRLTSMRLWVGTSLWKGASQGCFHGMQLQAVPCSTASASAVPDPARLRDHTEDWGPSSHEHVLLTGLDRSMPQFVFAEFNLQALSQNVSALGRLHRASEDALAACPLWQGAPFAQVRIYTDGSYCSRTERAAWALCVLVCCDAQWQFAGFASDAVFTDKRFGSLGQGHVSAHVAELTAMAAAAAIVGNLPSAGVDICFDATAAAGVAAGTHCSQVLEVFCLRVTALMHAAQCRRGPVGWRHVRAHQGDPLNELADTAAKAALSGQFRAPLAREHLACIFQGTEVLNLWWSDGRPELPDVDRHGTASVGHVPPANPALLSRPSASPAVSDMQWRFRAVTYNCLSLCSLAQRDCLQQQFHQRQVQVVGLQETRRDCEPLSFQGTYVVFASRPLHGQLGCQLWISSCIPLGHTPQGGPILFSSQMAFIFHSTPRLLVVLFDAGGLSLAFCVAHAPTTATAEEEQREWWESFEATIRRLPRKYQPLILADANARLSPGSKGVPELSACINLPARLMYDMLLAQHMQVSGNTTDDGEPIVSWTGPRGQTACLDYPVLFECAWSRNGSAEPRPTRFDRKAMLTPAGRSIMQRIFRDAPRAPWSSHADDYLHRVNQHVLEELAAAFPLSQRRPRQPHVSDHAWSCIRLLRRSRRHLRHMQRRLVTAQLRRVWQAWRGGRRGRASVRLHSLRAFSWRARLSPWAKLAVASASHSAVMSPTMRARVSRRRAMQVLTRWLACFEAS